MIKNQKVEKAVSPSLDPDFLPAAIWNRNYLDWVKRETKAREVVFAVMRPDETCWHYHTKMLPNEPDFSKINYIYASKLLKFLLWGWGGNSIFISGADEVAGILQKEYRAEGKRAFDFEFMGSTCFGQEFSIRAVPLENLPKEKHETHSLGRNLEGCRIGFDLGGSDRKCAAVIDGKVVFSEEIPWDPYFKSDPMYHEEGITDSLNRAAQHLPRVDAIGGSSAGIYINNEPRVASLFRKVKKEDFENRIRSLFDRLCAKWNVPLKVVNDGDVTALAGAMRLKTNGILGVSMGTSQAVGYINPKGNITGWLNELAFAPVDYRPDAPVDEWSMDSGCGVQYFSQQAVARLLPQSGIEYSQKLPFAEQLEVVQEYMVKGDKRASNIYQTIGTYLGYSLVHYKQFYDFKTCLILGRVTSGAGGQIIIDEAKNVLAMEFPEKADSIDLVTPDETMKRHGQAIAAASLPKLP